MSGRSTLIHDERQVNSAGSQPRPSERRTGETALGPIAHTMRLLARNHIQKIAGPLQLVSGAGATVDFELTPTPGGTATKDVEYFIKVIQKSGTAARVGLMLSHGPEASVSTTHSAPIALTTLGAAYPVPCVLAGGTNVRANGHLGEWLFPIVRVGSTGGIQWIVVEIYEMRKPCQ